MRGFICVFAMLFAMALGSSVCEAEDVTMDYLGLSLSASLDMAGKSLKNEGVVLLVHDTLGHDHMELVAALQDSLRDQGLNSLAITLGLGIDKREGMFDCALEQDHRHEDAVDEIAAWVLWLKEKGATAITLAGHGRGANQAALYAINRLDKSVKRLVLMAPLMQTPESAEKDYQERFHHSLSDELAKAEELTANEEGNQLIDVPGFLTCPAPKVTAGAFADYYGANPKFETTNLLPSIKIPVLIAVGDQDPTLDEIQSKKAELGALKTVTLVVIPGEDHDFRDLGADELAKRIKGFMSSRAQG